MSDITTHRELTTPLVAELEQQATLSSAERFYNFSVTHPVYFLVGKFVAIGVAAVTATYSGFTGILNAVHPGTVTPSSPAATAVDICIGLTITLAVLASSYYIRSQILANKTERSIIALNNATKAMNTTADTIGKTTLRLETERNNAHQNDILLSLQKHENLRAYVDNYINYIHATINDDQKDPTEVAIFEMLVRDHTKRLQKAIRALPSEGLFMNPLERREITQHLYADRSGSIILTIGVYDIFDGVYKWHDEFLDFLGDSNKDELPGLDWLFIMKSEAPLTENEMEIVNRLKAKGVRCHRADIPHVKMYTEGGDFRRLSGFGFQMELFGDASLNLLRDPRKIQDISHSDWAANVKKIAWKGTTFCRRSSGKMTANSAEVLTVEEALLDLEGQGPETKLWYSDTVSKLIKVGFFNSPEDIKFIATLLSCAKEL